MSQPPPLSLASAAGLPSTHEDDDRGARGEPAALMMMGAGTATAFAGAAAARVATRAAKNSVMGLARFVGVIVGLGLISFSLSLFLGSWVPIQVSRQVTASQLAYGKSLVARQEMREKLVGVGLSRGTGVGC